VRLRVLILGLTFFAVAIALAAAPHLAAA